MHIYFKKKNTSISIKFMLTTDRFFFFFLISQIPFSYGVFPPYEGPAAKVT